MAAREYAPISGWQAKELVRLAIATGEPVPRPYSRGDATLHIRRLGALASNPAPGSTSGEAISSGTGGGQ